MAKRTGFLAGRIRVVVLIVIAIVLLIWGIRMVGSIFDVFAKRYTLITLVGDVAGLRKGAPVAIAGQRVGQVSRIDFIPISRKQPGEHLVIELEVSNAVSDQIRRDSRVILRAQGLLGDKYIDITPGSRGAPVMQQNDTLKSEPAMDIEQFMARGGILLDSASRAIADVRGITAGLVRGDGTMGQLLKNDELFTQMVAMTTDLRVTLRGMNDPNGTFGRLVHDPAMYNRLLSAVSRVDALTGAIMRGEGSIGKMIVTDTLYRGLLGTTLKADSAVANLSAFMNRMTTGNGTIQKLATDPAMYDALLKAVVDLQVLLAEVRANPKKYLPAINVKVF